MGYPIWITPAGDLGKIVELDFYTLNLEVIDPDTPLNNTRTAAQLGRSQSVSCLWNIAGGLVSLTATGLPYHGYGNPASFNNPVAQDYEVTWPYRAGTRSPAATPISLNAGTIGYWMNGVAMYSPNSSRNAPSDYPAPPLGFTYNASYESGVELGYSFNEDDSGGVADVDGAYHYTDYSFVSAWLSGAGASTGSATRNGLADASVIVYYSGELTHYDGHSKILGFALDGYPVYGPIGYLDPLKSNSGLRRMHTGYALKNASWRVGTPAADTAQWPLGIFIEDYHYVGNGDLDEHNGRFCVTPDYPDGTYAYFVTVDSSDHPVYPYIVGNTYYSTPYLPVTEGQYKPPVPGKGVPPKTNLTVTRNVDLSLVAGRLPPGLQIYPDNYLAGQPVNQTDEVGGTPAAVAQDKDYTFTIRATSETDVKNITDRTFKLTVTGNNPPQLLTGIGVDPPVNLGSYLDGDKIDIQLEALDVDNPVLSWSVISGSLPLGVTLDPVTGRLYGVVIPYVNLPEGAGTGWDHSRWEEYPWQFSTRSANKNYEFIISVSDGKTVDNKKYVITIYAHNDIRADNTAIFGDTTLFTADQDAVRAPIIVTEDLGAFGTYKADNYFSFKFDIVGTQNADGTSTDLDGDQVGFLLIRNDLPAELDIHLDTGWLTGYIQPQVEPSVSYTFGVQAYKVLDQNGVPTTYASEVKEFTLTILSSLDLDIQWLTDSDIGTIQAGEVSRIAVEAVSKTGQSLTYSLKKISSYSVIGTNHNPTLTAGNQLTINGTIITLDSNPTVLTLAAQINEAAITGVYASGATGYLAIYATPLAISGTVADGKIIVANGSIGDPLTALGITAGTYSIPTGSYGSRLPQGLTLLSDGSLSGRTSFQSFSFDKGTTTFDIEMARRGFTLDKTVFDKTYTFTVEATNADGSLKSQKTFSLKVNIATAEPYENVYVKCYPDQKFRDTFTDIIDNTDVFPQASIYRPNDPFWGKRRDITMLSSYGLTASAASDYIAAMQSRHYNKRYFFGEYGTSVAKDFNDNVMYEVIWVEMIEETHAYAKGVKQSPPPGSVDVRKVIPGWTNPNYAVSDPTGYTLKINDQYLMRRDLADALGRTNPTALPEWMSSVQKDGSVSGYVTRVPMVYLKPGEGDKVLYRLQLAVARNEVPDITSIPFIADRYILDNNLSQNFDTVTKKFTEHHYTTFDLEYNPILKTAVATVDFALDMPFNMIDGQSVSSIDAIGGFDGVITSYHGKTVIFAKQEQYDYLTYVDPITGIFHHSALYVDPANDGWVSRDGSTIIQGYVGSSNIVPNRRAGVWSVSVVDDIVHLDFLEEIQLQGTLLPDSTIASGVVDVRYGVKYGGNTVVLSVASIITPLTVPHYTILLNNAEQPIPTTFDKNTTRFLNAVDTYQTPETGDTFLKFPKAGIFA